MLPGLPLEFHGNFRFLVKVDGIFTASFNECKLPSLSVKTLDIEEGGQNSYVHRLPVRVSASTLTLKRGIARDGVLLEWYMQVLTGNMAAAPRSLIVVILDSYVIPISIWMFTDAYPIKWSGPTLNAGDKAVAIEEIELAHKGFEIISAASLMR
jgi:phage tail-like protein